MGALTDLWKSERGLVAVLLLIGATVLAALDKMSFADWREYTLYIFGTYAVTKTVTTGVALWRGATDPPTTPPVAPAVTPAVTPASP